MNEMLLGLENTFQNSGMETVLSRRDVKNERFTVIANLISFIETYLNFNKKYFFKILKLVCKKTPKIHHNENVSFFRKKINLND